MSDALKRAVRTYIQTFVGAILASGVFSAATTTGVVDWSALKKVVISAAFAGFVAFLSWAQNALENSGTVPKLLRG